MNPTVRLLTGADAPALRRLLQSDPVAYSMVSERLAAMGVGGGLTAELWGAFDEDLLTAAVYLGANVVPICADGPAAAAFAARARLSPRRCSSIVGPAQAVMDFFDGVAGAWGPAREIRRRQPLMAIEEDSPVTADPRVRWAQPADLDLLFPACVAMFTEELGISPLSPDGGSAYRRRVQSLISGRRAFVLTDNDAVVFKAEIGVVADGITQIQGVWVAPEHRGEGLSVPALAAVVTLARKAYGPTVSLYVNDFNQAALAAYQRVGFREVGAFATVLF